MTDLRVLGLAGSLRQASYNRALLRAAQTAAPDGMTIEAFDLLTVRSTTATWRRRETPRASPR